VATVPVMTRRTPCNACNASWPKHTEDAPPSTFHPYASCLSIRRVSEGTRSDAPPSRLASVGYKRYSSNPTGTTKRPPAPARCRALRGSLPQASASLSVPGRSTLEVARVSACRSACALPSLLPPLAGGAERPPAAAKRSEAKRIPNPYAGLGTTCLRAPGGPNRRPKQAPDKEPRWA